MYTVTVKLRNEGRYIHSINLSLLATHLISCVDRLNAWARDGMAGKYMLAASGENKPADAARPAINHFFLGEKME